MAAFRGARAFLSNFHPARVVIRPVVCKVTTEYVYPTAEHAFVHAKTGYAPEWLDRVLDCRTPGDAKRLGKTLPVCREWSNPNYRVFAMQRILRSKFSDPELAALLMNTGDEPLVERNEWHDTFWGACTCPQHAGRGENHLGRLLTQIRTEIREIWQEPK